MSQERFASCSLRDFILEEELCRGTHASIWKVKFKYDGKRYVLKELKLNGKISQRNAYKEVELLRQLDHRNCIRCYGHFVDDANKKICIVLEYCEGGDLAQFLTNQRNQSKYLDEGYIWSVFHQICLGVQHLHQMGIVHRDLKTSNIFLADNTPKVGDLGVSHQVSENTLMLQTFSGTPLYLSPELVRGHPYNEKTDIWSLGIVLYELCALTPPFFGGTLLNLAQAIDSAEIPPLPSQYSPKIDRFVKWLLQRDYTQRPSIAQMVEKISKRLTPIQNIHFPPASRNDLAAKAGAVFNAVAALDAKPSSTSPPIASAPSHLPESLVFDIQRLTILEKRDKMSLRKLLQTKTLSESSTCDQSQRSDQGLNDHIRIVQDRLTLLEEAISSGGRIQRDNAERLGLLSASRGADHRGREVPVRPSTGAPGLRKPNASPRRSEDSPLPRSRVKVHTSLDSEDRPAENLFQARRERQSLFGTSRDSTANNRPQSSLPEVSRNLTQQHPSNQRSSIGGARSELPEPSGRKFISTDKTGGGSEIDPAFRSGY